ncbi:TRMT1-like protein [Huso huso]|uniref:tRNA (guanine(27)-N(2))-dimethyltransferase n=1 Tax=Huso huso TaxID=61971 RepID=A0ABR0ZIV7_HUSHU
MAELQKEESVQLHEEYADDNSGSTAGEAKADHKESNIQQCDEGKEKTEQAEDATNEDPKDETGASTSSTAAAEKHISIQAQLTDLENLTDLNETGKKLCPLCSEEKFKACYNHKLRRHLQNLHWKVSVEFEGHRMCICHLPCRQLKPSLNGDQCSSRLGAHYHCIVCSATIARRTDMISHLKRHVNKGETEASYTGGPDFSTETKVSAKQSCEILKESDTNVQVLPNYSTPQKSDSYFSRKMKTNRQLVFCALAVLAEERTPLECLDAFGATGIMGLQWAQHLCSAVKVTINDINETSVKMIRENCHLNHMRVQGENDDSEGEELDEEPLSTIEVTKMDANVLMHLRAFDFIHLDPYGTAVNYLDAAFRNVRNLGIVSVTSTDTSSLYSKTLNVTLRHYSCHIVRTEYYKELAARMVIATVARAAARCNKGIKVLLAVALEHFVLVVVQVLRGPTQADELPKKIQQLIHCQWCEERVFLKEGSMVEENLYRQLPCDCHGSMPGKTAVELGPLWSGSLFNTGFLRRMLFEAVQHGMDEIQPLVKSLICESECTTLKQFSVPGLARNVRQECGVVIKTSEKEEDVSSDEQSLGTGKRKMQEGAGNVLKRQKSDVPVEHPAFYYSIHRHSIRGMNMPKLNKFLQYLTEAGFRVSRTHFDPTGVRTDATLAQFKSVLTKYSVPTYTAVQTGDHSHASDEVKLDMEFANP